MRASIRLNKNQQQAAEYANQHILVLAGAGTGKTLTIIARAEHLIRNGIDPQRILLLTFTRRASHEMIARLHMAIGNAAHKVTAGTFHHFCLSTMRKMPQEFGINDFTVIDRDDQTALMKLVRARYVVKGKMFPKASLLVNIFSYARNTNMDVLAYVNKHYDFDENTSQKIYKIFFDYTKRKHLNRYLDYDDILYRFAKKLHEDSSIRRQLRGFYDHILVDEMQDTNPLQWLILDGLKDPAKLFCVGDDAQSIYAFRGADFRNVHAFKQRIPDSVVLKLEDNYRSTQEILDISNWLLTRSTLNYSKNLKAQRGSGIKPVLVDFAREFDEARWIAEDLIERHNRGSCWKDHMVLTRTAWASRSLEAMLVEKSIPYVFIGGTSLLQAAHVKDLLCLMKAAASPYDELAWMRYLTLWPRIGDVTAARLIALMQKEGTLAKAFERLGGTITAKQQIVAGPDAIMQTGNKPDQALQTGARFLEPLLEQRYDKWNVRRNDFDLLVKLAERYRSLMGFIETYTLDPITPTTATQADNQDAVTLITVHSAKGTEAPVCYVIRVEPGMYPYIRSLGNPDEEEEERRILYVAMTRTQNELILTRSASRNSYAYSPPSATEPYFLSTVPDRLVEKHWQSELDFDEDEDLSNY